MALAIIYVCTDKWFLVRGMYIYIYDFIYIHISYQWKDDLRTVTDYLVINYCHPHVNQGLAGAILLRLCCSLCSLTVTAPNIDRRWPYVWPSLTLVLPLIRSTTTSFFNASQSPSGFLVHILIVLLPSCLGVLPALRWDPVGPLGPQTFYTCILGAVYLRFLRPNRLLI